MLVLRPERFRSGLNLTCAFLADGNALGNSAFDPSQPYEAQMNRLVLVLALVSLTSEAFAQTAGAPSGGGTSSGAAAPSAPVTRSVTPAPAPGGGTAAPSTSVSPPSRLLPNSAPSATAPAQPGTPSTGGAATSGAGTPAATTTPGAPVPGAPSGADPNLPATASGGRPQAGGANSSEQSTRTGKNPINERYADCVKLWGQGTHMSKAEWSRTCRRIENRIESLQVDNLNTDLSGPKPRKTGTSPEAA